MTVDYSNSAINDAIEEYIHEKRDRDILKRRLIDCITYDELAGEFEMSVRQIKNIVYREQDKLFKMI